jgi:mRNA interferase MazF
MNINQKEIWLVDFSPKIGAEISKIRPAVVVSNNAIGKLPLKTIVPITNWSESFNDYPWMINIKENEKNGLSKESSIDCFQIRNFSIKRFSKKIGIIDNQIFEQIKKTIIKTIS